MNVKSLFFNSLIIIILAYIIFAIIIFFIQKSLIYYPNNQDFKNCEGFDDYEKIEYNGTRFYFKNKSESVLVYYHGNAGSACDRSYLKSFFEKQNYSLIFVEYSGYSNDNKKPSKKLIFRDVKNINSYIIEKGFKQKIVIGESVGSGAASYHASFGNVDKLVLIAPFSSLSDVVKSNFLLYPMFFLLTEKYDNVYMLKKYEGDLLIIHGDNDEVIDYNLSKKLYSKVLIENKKYILISGYGHNDIWNSKEIYFEIDSFLR